MIMFITRPLAGPLCRLKWMSVLAGYLFMCVWGANGSRQKGTHVQIYEELISNYGPTSQRPLLDNNQIMDVGVGLQIQQVNELNEREQTLQLSAFLFLTWKDDFLSWNTTEYPDVPVMIIPTSEIWRPDIHLYQNVDRNFESLKDVGAFVDPDGSITWVTPVILTTSCRIDARLFPFDTQRCKLRFGSWAYGMTQINMKHVGENGSSVARYYIPNGIWELIGANADSQITEYGVGSFYAEVLFTILLKRRPLFHVLSFILPCALLSGLNILVFILPTVSGEKVSLGITNLLALVLFQQLIADSLPPSSDNMPIISYYFTPMIFVGCLSIASGVVVAALHHQDKSRPVPPWLRKMADLFSPSPPATADAYLKGAKTKSASITPESDLFQSRSDNGRPTSTSNGHKISTIAYQVECTKNEGDIGDPGKNIGNGRINPEWRRVASVIDSLSLAVGTVITVMAILTTIALFLVTNASEK